MLDLTERRQVEEQLRRSHNTYLKLIENAPFGVYLVDAQFRLAQVSAGSQKIFSNVHPLIGRDFAEVLRKVWPEPFISEVIEHFRHTLATGEAYHSTDTVEQRAGGAGVEAYDWMIERVTLPDGQYGVVCYFYDMTERRRTELALREAEERARLLLESTGEAIYGLDTEGNCTFCNPACMRLLGYENETVLLGQNMHDLIHHTRPDGSPYPINECYISKAFRRGENVHVEDEVFWRADGSSFPAEYWSQPIRRDDEIAGAVVTFIDITERKRYEQQLLEADRHKDEFIAMVAHELRNPLAPIRTATQVFELVELEDETLVEMRDVIKRQVEHMARLLDDLLDVSRIARGKIELRRERINLGEIVRTTAEDLRRTFNEHHVELTVHITAETLVADTDPTRISQCVGNILQNALKFTDEGGRVHIEMTHADHEAIIIISDTGIGMEADFIEHLFEPFRQADRSLHRSSGGLGLGLAMVKGLMDLHGGRVYATSDGPGKGSELIIHLPVEEP